MKAKSVIFDSNAVQATLDGSKTTHRIVVNPQPDYFYNQFFGKPKPIDSKTMRYSARGMDGGEMSIKPPYFSGDVLYVRERWKKVFADKHYWENGDIVSSENGVGYRYETDSEVLWKSEFQPLNDEFYITEIREAIGWRSPFSYASRRRPNFSASDRCTGGAATGYRTWRY